MNASVGRNMDVARLQLMPLAPCSPIDPPPPAARPEPESRDSTQYYSDDLNAVHDGEEHRKKIAWDDCPSQLTEERTELLELQWRDGYPVEQPVLDHRSAKKRSGGVDGDFGNACSPWEERKKTKKKAVGQKETSTAGEVVEDGWKLWREGDGAAAAHGYPQVDASSSSVNAKAETAAGMRDMDATVADVSEEERWRMWREGHGSSAPQDSVCKNSVLRGEDSLLPSSASSGGSSGAQRHSSEQTDQQCSTLDHAIEYLKSLQQQIQVLSSSGYGVQPLLFPCICNQPPHPAVPAAPAPAAPLYPALAPAAAAAAPLYPASPPPHLAAADLNPVMVAVGVGGPPGAESGSLVGISAGSAEEMTWRTP